MKRREFFKLTGLATGGILAAPSLVAALSPTSEQEEALDFAIRYALENGALYADARIGPCELQGHAQPIFQSDLAGFRICTASGWRFAVLRDLSRPALKKGLDQMLSGESPAATPGKWHSAVYDADKVIIRRSSDADTESELRFNPSRFASRGGIPLGDSKTLFLELLLEH